MKIDRLINPAPLPSFRRRPESRRGGVGQDRHTIGTSPTIFILVRSPRRALVISSKHFLVQTRGSGIQARGGRRTRATSSRYGQFRHNL